MGETEIRHAEKSTAREENLKATLKTIQTANTKAKKTHSQRYETELKRWMEQHSDKEKSFDTKWQRTMSLPDFNASRAFQSHGSLSGSPQPSASERAAVCYELFEHNSKHLARRRDFLQNTALTKIQLIRQRVDTIHEGRRDAEQRRFGAMRQCAIEKSHLTHKVERIKDSSDVNKINRILEDLGLDIPGDEKKEDGEGD